MANLRKLLKGMFGCAGELQQPEWAEQVGIGRLRQALHAPGGMRWERRQQGPDESQGAHNGPVKGPENQTANGSQAIHKIGLLG
jgi:hypothetical protein